MRAAAWAVARSELGSKSTGCRGTEGSGGGGDGGGRGSGSDSGAGNGATTLTEPSDEASGGGCRGGGIGDTKAKRPKPSHWYEMNRNQRAHWKARYCNGAERFGVTCGTRADRTSAITSIELVHTEKELVGIILFFVFVLLFIWRSALLTPCECALTVS